MLTLAGAGNWTGPTLVASGVLRAGASGAFAPASGVTVAAGAALDLAGTAQTIGSLAGAGNILLGSGTLTAGGNGASTTFAGAVTGTGSFAKAGDGTLTLTGSSTYAGGTTIAGGTLRIGDGGTTGRIAGNVVNNGTLAFDRSDVVTFAGSVSGSGALRQQGTGTTILTAASPYTGPTTVAAGTLAVGSASSRAAALSGTAGVTVASGATLGGYGTVAGTTANLGTIAVANVLPGFVADGPDTLTLGGLSNAGVVRIGGAAGMGNVLRVLGDYAGAGGAIALNTVLNAGGPLPSQQTDRLLIGGNVSGVTPLLVNAIGSGAFTSLDAPSAVSGISLVQAAGAASPGAFVLAGAYVTGGTPFRYQLYAYGPASANGSAAPGQSLVGNAGRQWDWRLQAVFVEPGGEVPPDIADPVAPPPPRPTVRPAVAPQIPTYLSASNALFQAGVADLGTLYRRLGEIRDDQLRGISPNAETFFRAYGGNASYSSDRGFAAYGYGFSQDYAAVQFGGSAIAVDDGRGTLRLGLAGAFGELWMRPDAVDGPSRANFHTQRAAAILTWQSRAGWYLDAVVSAMSFDGAVSTAQRGRTTKLGGSGTAASLEAGFPVAVGPQGLKLEPQAQVIHQRLDFGRRTDVDGVAVDLGQLDQGLLRIGVRLKRSFGSEGVLLTAYLKGDLLQGFGDGGTVQLGGVGFGTGRVGTRYQLGAGVTGSLTRNLSLYGDVTRQDTFSQGGFESWLFSGGLRLMLGGAP